MNIIYQYKRLYLVLVEQLIITLRSTIWFKPMDEHEPKKPMDEHEPEKPMDEHEPKNPMDEHEPKKPMDEHEPR